MSDAARKLIVISDETERSINKAFRYCLNCRILSTWRFLKADRETGSNPVGDATPRFLQGLAFCFAR
jgi:hypothetical protein